jgi:hypothetical protein
MLPAVGNVSVLGIEFDHADFSGADGNLADWARLSE